MNLSAIRHRNTESYIYPTGRNKLNIRLETAKNDFDSVILYYWPRYEATIEKRSKTEMCLNLSDAYIDYYGARLNIEGISAYTRYCFMFKKGESRLWLGRNGFSDSCDCENFFEFLWPNSTDSLRVPDWADSQIFYQIFPERFCNGDKSIDPEGVMPWGTKPTRENFMGGDLRGIINKLDYIKSLGVTCLYLTPIFRAPSNHKYDTVDYFDIDPAFGTKDDLRELVNGVHSRGMRILLDGVFNHCGYYWDKFQDVVKKGADSEYADWFFPKSFPIHESMENYDCVGHYKWMPKINLANEDTREYFISVGKYWIESFGIDGWRLDVADETPTQFWTFFADAIKKIKPDAILLGETWGDAGRLLSSDRLDTAMNYILRDTAVDWLAKGKIKPSEADARLNRMLSLYPYETSLRLYNPLDSHDTARFSYLCENEKIHKLALCLQMTVPGCPALYYGDEIGLTGDNDPDCRGCMIWDEDKQDTELLEYVKKLISIRIASKALTKGSFKALLCDDEKNVYAFIREYEDETAIVIINAGEEPAELKTPASGEWVSLLSGTKFESSEDGFAHIRLEPCSAEIIQRK